jgi:toxin ParE1/3/4
VAGLVDALEAAYRHILRAPGTGSPRYAHELALPRLRFRVCSRDPYLVFYIEPADRIEVRRVLHARRDIPAWLQNDVDPVGGG